MPSIDIGGVNLNYVEQGTGDEVILFVHGWLSSARIWQDCLGLLPEKYHAFALDLRGFGKSERVQVSINLPQFAQDIREFARQLGLAKFTYVGHSMGGATGLQFALDQPEMLKALVLVSTVPSHGAAMPPEMLAVTDIPLSKRDREEARGLVSLYFLARPPSPERVDEMVEDALSIDDEVYFASRDAFRSINFDVESRLGEIKIPTLIVAGDQDVAMPANNSRRTAQGIEGSQLEILEGNGHALILESPERFVDLLTGFIEERLL
jgi:pimeloyl-ACP methyl ester carboxylesterase